MMTAIGAASVDLRFGDCLDVLETLPAQSVEACVTDPPYHLTSIVKRFGADGAAPAKVGKTGAYARASAGFMGKRWDGGDIAFQPDTWAAVLRTLKPGAHLAAFGGTRGWHRMACAIEDAGFEIRDTLMWVYGSGFPKSHNLDGEWKGWGTALKPAWEPIVLARRPLSGTVAETMAEHRAGAINIEACKVGDEVTVTMRNGNSGAHGRFGKDNRVFTRVNSPGRWPANFLHDGSEDVLAAFPDAPGQLAKASTAEDARKTQNTYGVMKRGLDGAEPRDKGGSAARFFYCAKASRKDRDEGCEGLAPKAADEHHKVPRSVLDDPRRAGTAPRANHHPTVKPTELMRWLCRLITPPGGTILDPFTGSGSTGKAARLEGFNFIGIERELEYMAIAQKRLGLDAGVFA